MSTHITPALDKQVEKISEATAEIELLRIIAVLLAKILYK